MSAQMGFARSNMLPRDSAYDGDKNLAAPRPMRAVAAATPDPLGAEAVDLRVLCIEVSPQNLQKMQALFQAMSTSSAHGDANEALMQRAQRQLRLMGRSIALGDASATTVLELKERLLNAEVAFHNKEGSRSNITVQLMALRRPLEKRVASAASVEEAKRVASMKGAADVEDAELIVLPEGMPVALLREQSEDANSPLQLFSLPPLPGTDGKKDLVVFYTYSETLFGVDWSTVCACACCAALCACCIAALCCCCKSGDNDRDAQPEGNAGNPYGKN